MRVSQRTSTALCAGLAALALLFAVSARAQTETNTQTPSDRIPSNPCLSEPEYAQFDFWLGTWDVYTPDETFAGVNRIEKAENGCLILETWSGASGSTGQSYNFYNALTEEWRQVWVGGGVIIDYAGGLTESGAMRLDGEIYYPAQNRRAAFFGEWTPQNDGSVLQHFEEQDAESGEWTPWFTGLYRPKAEGGAD